MIITHSQISIEGDEGRGLEGKGETMDEWVPVPEGEGIRRRKG